MADKTKWRKQVPLSLSAGNLAALNELVAMELGDHPNGWYPTTYERVCRSGVVMRLVLADLDARKEAAAKAAKKPRDAPGQTLLTDVVDSVETNPAKPKRARKGTTK